MKDIPLNERLIFALDVDSPEKAYQWVEKLDSHVRFFKVGLQLFLAGWFQVVDWISRRGNKVMLDLKFFDVPETVKLAVKQLENRNVTLTTVHGNASIIRAAVEAKKEVKIMAVTVLTSFNQDDIKELGFQGQVVDLVCSRAKKALELGCDGLIASGLEASKLRSDFGRDFLIVTPGIRSGKDRTVQEDDQKRILTAGRAIANGADHIVVGRPIRTANDPIRVVKEMQSEIKNAL